MTNKKTGNKFESQFCEILSENGYWVHNLAQNAAGQPADVIAVRDGEAYLIDCKVCSNGKFALSRMEENQDLAMKHWADCGNGFGWFAFLLKDQSIYLIPHSIIQAESRVRSSLSENEIREYGALLYDWVVR